MNAHPLDLAAAVAAPLRASLHAGNPDVVTGRKDYVAAADGLYVRARTPALNVSTRIATATLPYAGISEYIVPANGPVPTALLREFADMAVADKEREIAAVIVADNTGYRLIRVDGDDRSAGHVTYDDTGVDDDALVIDLHSHGRLPAYFSGQDDRSDLSRRGPYLAMVVGQCDRTPTFACRLVLPPHLVELDLLDLYKTGVLL